VLALLLLVLVEISCYTQEDIDLGAAPNRVAAIRAWRRAPDLVSLNLAEDGVIELGAALLSVAWGSKPAESS